MEGVAGEGVGLVDRIENSNFMFETLCVILCCLGTGVF